MQRIVNLVILLLPFRFFFVASFSSAQLKIVTMVNYSKSQKPTFDFALNLILSPFFMVENHEHIAFCFFIADLYLLLPKMNFTCQCKECNVLLCTSMCSPHSSSLSLSFCVCEEEAFLFYHVCFWWCVVTTDFKSVYLLHRVHFEQFLLFIVQLFELFVVI